MTSPTTQTRTILIIDGDPLAREALGGALECRGFTIKTATSVQTGSVALAQFKPDVVIIELDLPDGSGLSIIEQTRKRGDCKQRFIVLTSSSAKDTVIQVIKFRVNGYLLKSNFKLENLIEKINLDLSRPSAHAGADTSTPESPAPNTAPAGMLQDADPTAALRSLKPLLSRSEVMDAMAECEQFKAFSPTVTQILHATSRARCPLSRVSKLISQDQALALKILKLANSAVYSRGEPVESVHKAVLRIGLDRIRQAVLNIAVVDQFSTEVLGEHFNFAHFWEHSIGCGVIAAHLANTIDQTDADTAFTMGLLHDVGRMICVESLPNRYVEVFNTATRLGVPLEQAESRLLLLNHADVMDHVLKVWNLPKELHRPIACHHLSAANLREHAIGQLNESAILALANRLCHGVLLGSSGNEVVYPTEALCDLLSLDGDAVDSILADAVDEARNIKFSMLSVGTVGNWPEKREEYRERLAGAFRPLFVSTNPGIDAYRLLCNTLADPPCEQEPPTIAIVHAHASRERVALGNALGAAQSKAGVANLPLLILSPKGNISLEPRIMDNRVHAMLRTPLALSRFIDTVNSLSGSATVERAA